MKLVYENIRAPKKSFHLNCSLHFWTPFGLTVSKSRVGLVLFPQFSIELCPIQAVLLEISPSKLILFEKFSSFNSKRTCYIIAQKCSIIFRKSIAYSNANKDENVLLRVKHQNHFYRIGFDIKFKHGKSLKIASQNIKTWWKLPFQFVAAFALLSLLMAAGSNISVVATFSEVFTKVCRFAPCSAAPSACLFYAIICM